uniref:Poly [ADP-ribose] polymerase 10/14/15 n=1 Tax=Tetraselmis sp. GSL018 TaxID=582737 RepID=A0A061R3R0_9CHLO
MKQKNTKTGFERRVVRKSSRHQVPDLEVIKEISGYNNGREVLGISYMALDCASSQKACKSVKSEISAGSWGGEKLESFCIPLPDHALSSDEEVQMREILSTFKVSFDIRTFGGQSSSIYLSGLSKEMDRAKDAIVKHPLYQANSFYTFPDNWTSTDPSHNALVDVATGSEEFHAVAAKFVGDLPSAIVERVQRVENVLLYKSYQGNLQILHERYSVNGQHILTNEQLIKKLWHGTSQTDPEVVVLSSYGTEKCHSSPSCLWGQGNYFSTTSAYVDRGYAHRSNGLKKMVLFEVITGLACDMNQDRSLLKPPPVPADHWVREKFGEANAPPNLSFDSVTGVTCETRVYITYSTGVAQQYPLYIVSYKTP